LFAPERSFLVGSKYYTAFVEKKKKKKKKKRGI